MGFPTKSVVSRIIMGVRTLRVEAFGAWFVVLFCVFFFQAEDGIRDPLVTGVQTCALPISVHRPHAGLPCRSRRRAGAGGDRRHDGRRPVIALEVESRTGSRRIDLLSFLDSEIGRASCRERV